MRIDRRDFLRLASAGPLVFGLNELWAQDSAPQESPAWWTSALSRMKELGRPGLVFIAPEEEAARADLARAILDLLESEDSRAREIFCSAVVTCLRPEVATACLGDEAAPCRVLILDPAGRIVERADLHLATLKDIVAFEEVYARRIHGEGEARLAAAADRVRAKLTDDEKKALANITAEEAEAREKATAVLGKSSEALMPLLVHERRSSKDPARAASLRTLIDARFAAASEKSPGTRLPFGTRIDPGWSCGPREEGVAIQCGMARLEGKGQRFLIFLEK